MNNPNASISNTLYLKRIIEEYGIPLKPLAKKADDVPLENLQKILKNNIPLSKDISDKLLWHAISLIPSMKFKKSDTKVLPDYAKTIKTIMEEQKLTPDQLGKKIGKTGSCISSIVNGGETTTSTLKQIANATGHKVRIQFMKK